MVSDATIMALTILEHELDYVGGNVVGHHAIFGSASLVMRGIIDRDPGDIDVLVSRKVWGDLLARPRWNWLTPCAGDPPILASTVSDKEIHLFFDWRDPWLEIDVTTEIRDIDRVYIEGCKFLAIKPENVKRHKLDAIRYPQNSKRDRHLDDVARIDAYLRGVR